MTEPDADSTPQQIEGTQQPVPEWTEWENVEVMTQLLRRNIDPVIAKGWVRDRQLPYAEAEITSVLTAKYLDENDNEIVFEIPQDRRTRR